MTIAWILPLFGLLSIGTGIWQYRITLNAASLDALWQREEHELLARGVSRQRPANWGYSLQRGAAALIVFGVFFTLLGIFLAAVVAHETPSVSNSGPELLI